MDLNNIEDMVAYYGADIAGMLLYLETYPDLLSEYYTITGYHVADPQLIMVSTKHVPGRIEPEKLKHLPGRHDQKRHDPHKGVNAADARTLAEGNAYLSGEHAVDIMDDPFRVGHYVNPPSPQDLESWWNKEVPGRRLGIGLYDTRTGAIAFPGEEASVHADLMLSMVPNIGADNRGKILDRSVRFNVYLRDGKIEKVTFDTGMAASVSDRDRAYDNIYRAMDKLSTWGFRDDMPVDVYDSMGRSLGMDSVGLLQTTIKHLPGRHDQQRHAGESVRSVGGATVEVGNFEQFDEYARKYGARTFSMMYHLPTRKLYANSAVDSHSIMAEDIDPGSGDDILDASVRFRANTNNSGDITNLEFDAYYSGNVDPMIGVENMYDTMDMLVARGFAASTVALSRQPKPGSMSYTTVVSTLKHLPGRHPQSRHAPHSSNRVWQGQQHPKAHKLTKLETGEVGEQVAMHALQEHFNAEFRTVNVGINNAPIDVIGDHTAVEVKTGLASNQPASQKWRLTIGQPGKAEAKALESMTIDEKAAHNRRKLDAIMQRKQDLVAEFSREIGVPIKPLTVGIILNPEATKADVFVIDGFHETLRWNAYATDDYYLGTYDVDAVQSALKHLPGRHDQQRHAGIRGSATGEYKELSYEDFRSISGDQKHARATLPDLPPGMEIETEEFFDWMAEQPSAYGILEKYRRTEVSGQINGRLRNGEPMTEYLQEVVDGMEHVFWERMPGGNTSPANVKLYRALPKHVTDDLKVGDSVIDMGYTSTAYSRKNAEWFGSSNVIEIQLNAGDKAIFTGSGEGEVILPRGTEFVKVGAEIYQAKVPTSPFPFKTIKHLPGRHDQKRHDPYKGGTTLGVMERGDIDVVAPTIIDADEEVFDWYIEDVVAETDYMGPGYTGFGDEEPVGPAGSIAAVEGTSSSTQDLIFETHIDMDERSRWKEHVVKDLAERSGLSEERVNHLVKSWAETSNDHSPVSLGMQKAAAEEFGVDLSDWQQRNIDEAVENYRDQALSILAKGGPTTGEVYDTTVADGRKLWRASYEATQEQLRDIAPDGKVTLYRGVAGAHIPHTLKQGDVIPIKSNSVESWSLSFDTAESFADGHWDDKSNAIVLKAEIPIERILATPKTGPGCMSEFEFLVLGSGPGGADYAGVATMKKGIYYAGVD